MMGKILHLTSGRGGEFEIAKKLCAYLTKYCQNDLFSLTTNRELECLKTVRVLDEELLSFKNLYLIKKKIKPYDLILMHYLFNYYTIIIFLFIKLILRKRVIIVFHAVPDGPGSLLRQLYYFVRLFTTVNTAAMFADKLVFLTFSQNKNYQKICFAKKRLLAISSVIYNFVDDRYIAKKPKAYKQPIHVAFVAKLTKYKGYRDLTKLILTLKNSNRFFFHIVGAGKPDSELLKLYHVKHYGGMPNDQVFQIYDKCQVLMVPSYHETFGLVILEAMARGLVVIASALPVIKEYFIDKKNGYLFAPGDIDRMKTLLTLARQNPAILETISAFNLENIHNYTLKRQGEKYWNICRQYLADKRTA